MNTILCKKELAPGIKLFKVHAPFIARKAKPGQFIVLRIDERGERIPLTIADLDDGSGNITLVFQEVGKTTMQLGTLKEDNVIADLIGPLGRPSEIEKYGTVVCVGGGIGIAPVYPIARALKKAGNRVLSIIGARTKELLILEKEMRDISDEFYITTDDGTYGRHGFVTDELKNLIGNKIHIDVIYAIGPAVMMKAVSNTTRESQIKTIVSLNSIMVDATGMCGVCRVSVDNKTKFACVDGPEFDGHKVDFDLLIARQKIYLSEEKIAKELYTAQCGGC